jgi:hypothetical protein
MSGTNQRSDVTLKEAFLEQGKPGSVNQIQPSKCDFTKPSSK